MVSATLQLVKKMLLALNFEQIICLYSGPVEENCILRLSANSNFANNVLSYSIFLI